MGVVIADPATLGRYVGHEDAVFFERSTLRPAQHFREKPLLASAIHLGGPRDVLPKKSLPRVKMEFGNMASAN
jgi:hypothetical protein